MGGCRLLAGMRAVLIAIFLSLLCGRACAYFTRPCALADAARPFTLTLVPTDPPAVADAAVTLVLPPMTENLHYDVAGKDIKEMLIKGAITKGCKCVSYACNSAAEGAEILPPRCRW